MRTSKPFATISYNSASYLSSTLDKLVEQNILDFWCFIEHLPEDDETKKHKHLFCVPVSCFDCRTLIDYLQETDESNPTAKPLTCIIPRSSKFDDWYQYSLHDVNYLASKGQARKYHYTVNDIIRSNDDYFNDLRYQINYSKINRMERIIAAVNNGETFESLLAMGQIPIQLINQYKSAYDMLRDNTTYRNGRENHEDKE